MRGPSSDPSINEEPHRRAGSQQPDPTETKADRLLRRNNSALSDDEKVEHTVWDEPGLSHELAGNPKPGELMYATWLDERRARTSAARSWGIICLLALLSGPWAVLGAIWGSGQTAFSVLALVVFAPVVEEAMKLAAAAYVVEKRPFLFRSRLQILICALASGLAFAAIENLLYLHVYIPNPSPSQVAWRWTICTGLHAGCSLIGGLGLARIWKDVWARRGRARQPLGFPYLVTAIIIHGTYNGVVLLFYIAGLTF